MRAFNPQMRAQVKALHHFFSLSNVSPRVSISFKQIIGLASSLALDHKQTGGKQKKERKGKRAGERDIWTTRSENEVECLKTSLLKFDWLFRQHERKPPVKILTGLVFETRSSQVSLSFPSRHFFSSSLLFVY